MNFFILNYYLINLAVVLNMQQNMFWLPRDYQQRRKYIRSGNEINWKMTLADKLANQSNDAGNLGNGEKGYFLSDMSDIPMFRSISDGMALLAAAIALLVKLTFAEDFCRDDIFPQPRDVRNLHFSKELSEEEFAVVGNFMSLHCCAASFRSIEWFKDGQPHPWPGHVSSLIINPASLNQTIYSQGVDLKDTGIYHCLVSNGSHVLRHQVQLTVTGPYSSVEPPKATYKPKDKYLRIGEAARFYCEAYVGNIQLPDAVSEIVWSKENGSNLTESNISQRVVYREGKRVLGSYLTIDILEEEDFGQYDCKVSNTADQFLQLSVRLYQIKDMHESIGRSLRLDLAMAFAAFSTLILLVTIYRFRLQFQMLGRNLRRRFHSTESSEVDVTVLYHELDSATALTVIVPTLQFKYQYTCAYREIHPQIPLNSKELSSRRLFVILTPAVAGGVWTPRSLADAIHLFLAVHSKVICLFLQELPLIDIKTEDGRHLKETLSRVHYITYLEAKDKNFWTIVQLGLPSQKKHRTRQSRESLEQLM